MPRFSLSDVQMEHPVPHGEQDSRLCEAYLQYHQVKLEGLKDLCKRLPAPGEALALWTLKQFNAFTFIPYVSSVSGPITELIITTYSISTKVIDSLILLADRGHIQTIHLAVSDSVRFRIPRVVDYLEALLPSRENQLSVTYCWNHSKIALMQSAGNYFLLEGSGNFTENAQHEQYILINSQQMYEFRKACIYGIQPK